MSTPWKSEQMGYEDVPLAVDEIVRSEKEWRLTGWIIAAALALANLIGLSVTVIAAQWLLPTVNPVITSMVTAAAYVVCVIGIGIEKLCRRINRMEVLNCIQ